MTVRRAAVWGSPIDHSLSPVLHRAAYAALGLDWSYAAMDVTEEALARTLGGLGPEWVGLSLTMPLKTAVLDLLDERTALVDVTQAANTVLLDDGVRRGDNTDVPGMQKALLAAAGDSSVATTAGIVGGGATARSALAAVAGMGCRTAHVAVRDVGRSTSLLTTARALDLDLTFHTWGEPAAVLGADLVVSTVPAGVADALVPAVPATCGVLLDVAYGSTPSALVAAWRRSGGATATGRDLLLWQAVDQVRLMTGQAAPIDAMARALAAVDHRG